MSNIVKAILTEYSDAITPFIQDIIYNTIPDGDVLRRVHNAPKKACRVSYDGCNTCTKSNEDSNHSYCTAMWCPDEKETYTCEEYFCPHEELPVKYDTQSKSNLVCGTNYHVTVAACYCKPEYQYRDKNSLKCLKTCP